MANSINVTQNKWSCITQLKGTSGCLCRSRCCCSLYCACPALSLVRDPSHWQIPVWLPLHQALVQAAAVRNCCSRGRWGKQTESFMWLRKWTLLCFLCPCSLCMQAPVLLTLTVVPRTVWCFLTARGAFEESTASFHGFSLHSEFPGAFGWVLLMAASSWVL